MTRHAAITVDRPPDDVERAWRESPHRLQSDDATVSFRPAPGDRGTEIHVELRGDGAGALGQVVQKVTGDDPLAKVKDSLRRFKALVETGEVPRSDGVPAGESLEAKLGQRPA